MKLNFLPKINGQKCFHFSNGLTKLHPFLTNLNYRISKKMEEIMCDKLVLLYNRQFCIFNRLYNKKTKKELLIYRPMYQQTNEQILHLLLHQALKLFIMFDP